MTVKELIAILVQCDENLEATVLRPDNRFWPVEFVTESISRGYIEIRSEDHLYKGLNRED